MTTTESGVLIIKDERGEIKAFLVKDEVTHDNIFYSSEKMSFENIKSLFK